MIPAWHSWVSLGASICLLGLELGEKELAGALLLLSNRQSHLLQAGGRMLPVVCLQTGVPGPSASPVWLPLASSNRGTWHNKHGQVVT